MLTDFDVDTLVQERLLIPELPQAGRVLGLDARRRVQRAELVRAQVLAMDIHGAYVEKAAFEAKRLLRIELDRRGGEAVVIAPGMQAAAQISEIFADFA